MIKVEPIKDIGLLFIIKPNVSFMPVREKKQDDQADDAKEPEQAPGAAVSLALHVGHAAPDEQHQTRQGKP